MLTEFGFWVNLFPILDVFELTILDKRVETQSKFSPPPTFSVDNIVLI